MALIWYGPWPAAGCACGPEAKAAPPFLIHSTQFSTVTGLVFGSTLPNAAVPSGPNRPPRPGAGMPLSLSFKLWQLAHWPAKIICPRSAGVAFGLAARSFSCSDFLKAAAAAAASALIFALLVPAAAHQPWT